MNELHRWLQELAIRHSKNSLPYKTQVQRHAEQVEANPALWLP